MLIISQYQLIKGKKYIKVKCPVVEYPESFSLLN